LWFLPHRGNSPGCFFFFWARPPAPSWQDESALS